SPTRTCANERIESVFPIPKERNMLSPRSSGAERSAMVESVGATAVPHSDGCDGLLLHRPLPVHRAEPRAGVERMVQRPEDRADAGAAAFPHLPALPPGGGTRPRISGALDRRLSAGARHAAVHGAV